MRKKYHVCLTDQERQQLHQLIRSGQAPARRIARGRVLLKVDENGEAMTDQEAARACEVSIGTVRPPATALRHRRVQACPLPQEA